jgi:YjbE family integral membrane protein
MSLLPILSQFDHGAISAYLEVVAINVLLSGDNVIVIGMAAAGLSPDLRNRAIAAGIAAAAVIRIVFAVIAMKLLTIPGITFFGGLLLLWICWTMFRDLLNAGDDAAASDDLSKSGSCAAKSKLFRHAIGQIIIADVSMSLDNVLAVAGAAAQNMNALIFGLVLSVLLMGVASSFVAAMLSRHRWLAWLGLTVIVYVAVDMLIRGGGQLAQMWS